MTIASNPEAFLLDTGRAGVRHVNEGGRAALTRAASALGFALLEVNLEHVGDKHALLDAISAALHFPPTFGHNWDALADSLGDLSWLPAPGYLLVLDHFANLRQTATRDFDTLLEILGEAANDHARAGVPFWVLLPASSAAG